MYLDFYQLREKPFSLAPDPAFLYNSHSHTRAIGFLQYGLQESKGFIQLTGPIGSGKTTVLRSIVLQFDERTRFAYIFNASAPFPYLLRSIMKNLQVPDIPPTREKLELLDSLHEYLLAQAKRHNRVVVIIDEAQNLGIKNLEELRLFSNFEMTRQSLIQVVLAGQPELNELLDLPELRQLKQRIRVTCQLAPLHLHEVKKYIDHRLQVAGSRGELQFTDDSCDAISAFSDGIPRQINSLCDAALVTAYMKKLRTIDKAIINEAAGEMNGSTRHKKEIFVARENLVSQPPIPPLARGAKDADLSAKDAYPPSTHDSRKTDAADKTKQGDIVTRKRHLEAKKNTSEDIALSRLFTEDALDTHVPPDKNGNENDRNPEYTAEAILVETAVKGESKKGDFFIESDEYELPAEQCPSLRQDTPAPVTTNTANLRNKLRHLLRYIRTEVSAVPAPDPGVPEDQTHPNSLPVAPHSQEVSDTDMNMPESDLLVLHLYNGAKNLVRSLLFWKMTRMPKAYLLPKKPASMPADFINGKIMILLKESGFARGTVDDLDLKKRGFCFVSADGKQSERQYIPYQRIIAVKFVDNFKEPWQKRFDLSGKSPKGRQVIVTLQNGEVIEGITLDKLEPHDDRFFLVSPNGAGNPSWTLIEKSGAAGILTEQFKTGIYAEEFLKLPEPAEEGADGAINPHETKGNFLFRMDNFRSALAEYEQVSRLEELPDRVQFKIALCHFNRAIQHLHANRYPDARREFLLAAVHGRLNVKAMAQSEIIDTFLK